MDDHHICEIKLFAKQRMDTSIDALNNVLAKIRIGSASTKFLDNVTFLDGSTVVVTPWDKKWFVQ